MRKIGWLILAIFLVGAACGGDDDDEAAAADPAVTTASAPAASSAAGPLIDPEVAMETLATTVTTAAPAYSEPGPNGQRLLFRVVGACTQRFSVLGAVSGGFTPLGTYTSSAKFPDGRPYLYLENQGKGKVSKFGTTPGWSWECGDSADGDGDPPGVYEVTVVDDATGRSVTAQFTVGA